MTLGWVGTIVFALCAVATFVLGCLDQRMLYGKMYAWRLKEPDAVEPSESALAARRASMFASSFILLLGAIVTGSLHAAASLDANGVRVAASQVASELEVTNEPGLRLPGSTGSDVVEAVDEVGGNRIRITSRESHRSGVDMYEITNVNGNHPVCLTVTTDNSLTDRIAEPWATTITATVDDGPC